MGIHREDVHQLERAEDVGGGEQALGYQHRIPRVPLLALQVGGMWIDCHLFLHLRRRARGRGEINDHIVIARFVMRQDIGTAMGLSQHEADGWLATKISHRPGSPCPDCHITKASTTHLEVGNNTKGDCCHIQRICYKIYHIPHVVNVFLQANIPKLLHLTPYQACTETPRERERAESVIQSVVGRGRWEKRA